MSEGVVVPNNIWILEPCSIPIGAPFYLISTYLQGVICCHQHYGVIWILHSMNMEMLAINYCSNGIRIAYLLPSI